MLLTLAHEQIFTEVDILSKPGERLCSYQYGAYIRQFSFCQMREGAVEKICTDQGQDRVPQELQALIGSLSFPGYLIDVGAMGKGQAKECRFLKMYSQYRL